MTLWPKSMNLSIKHIEYQVLDRLSFRRFLGLSLEDPVPDATLIEAPRRKTEEQQQEKAQTHSQLRSDCGQDT